MQIDLSIRRGEGIEITQESMHALAEDVKTSAILPRENGRDISPASS
jgi:hypothetical protein